MKSTGLSRIQHLFLNLKSYYRNNFCPLIYGVPEGSILGPVLFLIYTNDLLTSFDVIQTIAYADDVNLIASGDSKSTTITTLQAFLNTAYDWSILNKLCLNPAKCASMLLCPTKLKSDALHETSASLYIGKMCIQYVFSMKLLGVIFSSDLSWRAHTCTVCSKLSQKLAVLRRIGCLLDTREHAHTFSRPT